MEVILINKPLATLKKIPMWSYGHMENLDLSLKNGKKTILLFQRKTL